MQNLCEKIFRAIRFRIRKKVFLAVVFDNEALVHEDHAMRDLAGKTHLVGDDHHGHALAGEVDHHVEHLADHFGIERRGRFVEQHRNRIHRQRARDRDALLLTTGQFGRYFLA